jgi:PAS domain S-box-containing protein
MDKPLRDLIEIIHFTEDVSAKIPGLLGEAEIYRTVTEEFARSKRYTASILLLTEDGSSLRIVETSLPSGQLRAGEKTAGVRLKGYKIDLDKSSIYSQVVREGKTLQVNVSDVIGELFPRPLAYLISKTMGYEKKPSILTPLKRHGEMIGIFAMSSTELGEHFIPSVRNLAQHISTALELADEYAGRKEAEEALERRVTELQALNAMATIVNESLDVDDILNRAIVQALRQVGVEAAAMLLLDEEAGELVMVAHRGLSEEFVRDAGRVKLGQGLAGQAAQTGEPVVMAHLADYPGASKPYVERERIQCAAAVPLIGSAGVMGAMNLASRSPHTFDAAGLELLVALGRQIATGVEKARLSQETFRVVAENASDGILIATGEGVHVYANKRAAEITDYSVAELLRTTIKDLVHPDEFEKIMERYRKRLAGKPVPRQYETIIIRKDGESVPIEMTAAKTVWQGQPADMVIIRDITERKQAEEALREYSERLEEMVEERTRELRDAQERLIRQEKLAVLGQLAGGVSHELRNPLGAIKNAAYFLNMVLEEPEPKVKETLEILEKEVDTSERIISSLLDYARPKPPVRRKVDVNDVVQEALSRAVVPEDVEVVSQLDEALPSILADPDQLAQVFGNIVLNAIQAMPRGGQLTVKTAVSGRGDPRGRPWVAVSFTDTGVGIPEENLGRVFEPLFTTKAKGIGLGLAVVKTLMEGHGGSIEVESTVGEGSTFTVRLPLAS